MENSKVSRFLSRVSRGSRLQDEKRTRLQSHHVTKQCDALQKLGIPAQ